MLCLINSILQILSPFNTCLKWAHFHAEYVTTRIQTITAWHLLSQTSFTCSTIGVSYDSLSSFYWGTSGLPPSTFRAHWFSRLLETEKHYLSCEGDWPNSLLASSSEVSAIASVYDYGSLTQIQISSAYQLSSTYLVLATRRTRSSRFESHAVASALLHCPPSSLFIGVDSPSSMGGFILATCYVKQLLKATSCRTSQS